MWIEPLKRFTIFADRRSYTLFVTSVRRLVNLKHLSIAGSVGLGRGRPQLGKDGPGLGKEIIAVMRLGQVKRFGGRGNRLLVLPLSAIPLGEA